MRRSPCLATSCWSWTTLVLCTWTGPASASSSTRFWRCSRRPGPFKIGMVAFSHRVSVIIDLDTFERNEKPLSLSADRLETRGGTELFLGLNAAMDQLPAGERSCVALISDGCPTSGTWTTADDILTQVQRHSRYSRDLLTIHTIALGGKVDFQLLQQLAVSTPKGTLLEMGRASINLASNLGVLLGLVLFPAALDVVISVGKEQGMTIHSADQHLDCASAEDGASLTAALPFLEQTGACSLLVTLQGPKPVHQVRVAATWLDPRTGERQASPQLCLQPPDETSPGRGTQRVRGHARTERRCATSPLDGREGAHRDRRRTVDVLAGRRPPHERQAPVGPGRGASVAPAEQGPCQPRPTDAPHRRRGRVSTVQHTGGREQRLWHRVQPEPAAFGAGHVQCPDAGDG